MFKWLRKLFAPLPEYCPLCGNVLVHWVDWAIRNGYKEERLWFGCTTYNDMTAENQFKRFDHFAQWVPGERIPFYDRYTGKKLENE